MRFTKTIATASVAAVLGLAGVSVAGAETGGSSPSPTTTAPAAGAPAKTAPDHPGKAALRRRRVRRAGALAAKTIGIEPSALKTELRAGKTIAEVATEHGVDPQTVVDAIEQAAKTRIEQAKDAGKLSADQAAKLEQRVDTAVPKLVNEWHVRNAPSA